MKTIAGVRGFPVVKMYVEKVSKFTTPIKTKNNAGLVAWNIIAAMFNLVSFLLISKVQGSGDHYLDWGAFSHRLFSQAPSKSYANKYISLGNRTRLRA